MELVDLAPALTGADGAPASRVPRVRRDARLGRPGQGDRRAGHGRRDPPRDRRADRAREAVRREGPRPPRRAAGRRAPRTDREVPGPRDARPRSSSAAGASEGDLDPRRRRRRRDDRTTCSGGCASSSAGASASRTRTSSRTAGCTASRCTSGTRSTAAGTRPTTRSAASCPRTRSLLTTTSGDLDDRDPGDPAGRARAMQYDVALNGWELGGGSVRIWDPRAARPQLQPPGLHRSSR